LKSGWTLREQLSSEYVGKNLILGRGLKSTSLKSHDAHSFWVGKNLILGRGLKFS